MYYHKVRWLLILDTIYKQAARKSSKYEQFKKPIKRTAQSLSLTIVLPAPLVPNRKIKSEEKTSFTKVGKENRQLFKANLSSLSWRHIVLV